MQSSSFSISLKLACVLTITILVSTNTVSGQNGYASFYEKPHCRGNEFGAELSYSCQNLPRGAVAAWRLSIDTNGHCVSLYDGWNCEGTEVANFNARTCRNVYAINPNIRSFRGCSGRTNSAVISG